MRTITFLILPHSSGLSSQYNPKNVEQHDHDYDHDHHQFIFSIIIIAIINAIAKFFSITKTTNISIINVISKVIIIIIIMIMDKLDGQEGETRRSVGKCQSCLLYKPLARLNTSRIIDKSSPPQTSLQADSLHLVGLAVTQVCHISYKLYMLSKHILNHIRNQSMAHIVIYYFLDQSSNALVYVEEWNPEDEAWNTVQVLESPRGGFSAVSLDDLSLVC